MMDKKPIDIFPLETLERFFEISGYPAQVAVPNSFDAQWGNLGDNLKNFGRFEDFSENLLTRAITYGRIQQIDITGASQSQDFLDLARRNLPLRICNPIGKAKLRCAKAKFHCSALRSSSTTYC